MQTTVKNTPLVLLILDGFGIAAASRGNAITQANMRTFGELVRRYPTFSLAAAGEAVGLPWGEPGNSEVGHLNLGAGKIVYQEVLRINTSIEDGSFFGNETLAGAIAHCKKHNSSLHLAGLVSDGGVHSHQDHLYALLELANRAALKRVYVHVFLDGRDTAFNSGLGYVQQLERIAARLGVGSIATISGRFWAMDRDNHYERIEKVYWAMVKGESERAYDSAAEAIAESYANKVYDEEFVPTVIRRKGANGASRIQPGDGIIFFNYRPDRARELVRAFVLPTFTKFDRTALSNLHAVTLTEYEPDTPVHVAYPKELVEYPLARAWSEAGLTQLHIAETEKYAHVTYFFNGGKDIVFPGQENSIIPSLGAVSYAEKPEMSIQEITSQVAADLAAGRHHCYVVNFANPDMVGHTGNLRATVAGLSYVDASIAALSRAVEKRRGILVVTADHGNAEEMVNWENGHIMKEHSSSPVPAVLVGEQFKLASPKPDTFTLDALAVSGVLSDVAPTLLTLLGLPIPEQMTSRSLI
ncbi:MAG: 2,3-bisphosphoglycerate-independent phosphoglycerate mutase [Parcubacteria group bacterium]|nr:2,3-bisphosphoglycerate-independent phosphoglycerate mutase [Parcubacteria group bacterium]